ncbi:hypothetical protein ACLOJK_024751 [Asimina triloba]
MAETKREEATSAISPSDSGELPRQDPEIFRREDREEEEQGEKKEEKGDTEGRGEKGEEEEAGEAEAKGFRPSKRRKNCPAALEKSLSSNRGFSFSFDIKVAANGPIESTPKFGSFNHSDGTGIGIGLGRAVGGPPDEEGKKRVGEVESIGAEEEKGV